MRISGIQNHALLALMPIILWVPILSARYQNRSSANQERPHSPQNDSHLYQKWLDEDVHYIITDAEHADFEKLTTDDQRDQFIEDFWNRRNPTRDSTRNPYKEEHYRRLAYANTHFAAGVPGWKTDRGRYYIIYGQPDRIDAQSNSAGVHSAEIWRYNEIKGLGKDVHLEFLDTCECGDYQLSIERSANLPHLSKRNERALRVVVAQPWHKWLSEDVLYIISDQERSDFLKLTTDEQRDEFVTDFWEHRNPTPGAPENKFKEEHYRRIAYTNQHFAARVPGWKTDRGRLFIMYGPPDSVESKPNSAPPTETWHYMFIEGIGRNVVFGFTDSCVCGKYEFTDGDSEHRAPKIFDPLQP